MEFTDVLRALESRAEDTVRRCIGRFGYPHDVFIPDAKGCYPAFWQRDFGYALEYMPECFETDMIDLPFISKKEIGVTPWGTFIIDNDTMMTTMPGVFAGGDVARGPDTVIQAIADGKNAAVSIDKYLGGSGKLNKGVPIDIPDTYSDDEIVEHPRFRGEALPPDKRKLCFDEVDLGYHKLNAMAEAMRCLHCDRR